MTISMGYSTINNQLQKVIIMSKHLEKLESEQIELVNQLEIIESELNQAETELEQSFISGKNTDVFTGKVARLKTKQEFITKAIKTQFNAIEIEQERIKHASIVKANAERREHVKSALECIERAIILRDELTAELKAAFEHNIKANITNRAIENSPRRIVGKMCYELNLHGSVSAANSIQPARLSELKEIQYSIKD